MGLWYAVTIFVLPFHVSTAILLITTVADPEDYTLTIILFHLSIFPGQVIRRFRPRESETTFWPSCRTLPLSNDHYIGRS